MPRELVERQVYQLPGENGYGGYGTLSNPFERRRLVKPDRWQNYSNLHKVAGHLGLEKTPDLETPQATWKMYRKGDLTIPNFEAPDTKASIELGLYEVPDPRFESEDSSAPAIAQQAILRMSGDYQPRSRFYADIEGITKYYLERPRFKGIPNRLHGLVPYVFTGLAVGLGSGVVYDNLVTGELVHAGAIIGETAGPIIGALGYLLVEKYSGSHISDWKSYRANGDASSALHGIEQHITKVSIQRELYTALQDVKMDRTPEQFLEDVWSQMPEKLVRKREEEMKQAIGEGSYVKPIPIDAIDRMVQVAQVLNAA